LVGWFFLVVWAGSGGEVDGGSSLLFFLFVSWREFEPVQFRLAVLHQFDLQYMKSDLEEPEDLIF